MMYTEEQLRDAMRIFTELHNDIEDEVFKDFDEDTSEEESEEFFDTKSHKQHYIMKKQVESFIRNSGGEPHYQGSTKTMWVDQPWNWKGLEPFSMYVFRNFGADLPFNIKINL